MPKERTRNILDTLGNGFNALMVFKPENIFYLTGFWGESVALCTHDGIKLFVPKLESTRAMNESKDSEIITAESGTVIIIYIITYLTTKIIVSLYNEYYS